MHGYDNTDDVGSHRRISAGATTAMPFGCLRPHPLISGLSPRAEMRIGRAAGYLSPSLASARPPPPPEGGTCVLSASFYKPTFSESISILYNGYFYVL